MRGREYSDRPFPFSTNESHENAHGAVARTRSCYDIYESPTVALTQRRRRSRGVAEISSSRWLLRGDWQSNARWRVAAALFKG